MSIYAVTGFSGKLGSRLVQRPNFIPLQCDITDEKSIELALGKLSASDEYPDYIVNCAAISSVEKCEESEGEAVRVNVRGLWNLHSQFGSRVLNISSDYVFNGGKPAKEGQRPVPNNFYGWSKFGAEAESKADGGKTIRLSRTTTLNDPDIHEYLASLARGEEIHVPTFFSRNYTHPEFAVDGIEYFVQNWDRMPQVVNYGVSDVVNFHTFMTLLAVKLGYDKHLVLPRSEYSDRMVSRPKGGGLKIGLANDLGFPKYRVTDTISELFRDYHA